MTFTFESSNTRAYDKHDPYFVGHIQNDNFHVIESHRQEIGAIRACKILNDHNITCKREPDYVHIKNPNHYTRGMS